MPGMGQAAAASGEKGAGSNGDGAGNAGNGGRELLSAGLSSSLCVEQVKVLAGPAALRNKLERDNLGCALPAAFVYFAKRSEPCNFQRPVDGDCDGRRRRRRRDGREG